MPTYIETRPRLFTDTECYKDYWSIGFKSIDGRKKVYEFYPGHPLDKKAVASVFRRFTVITFNGQKYDMPMILLAMSDGVSNQDLKDASDELIQFGTPHWVFMERRGLKIPSFVDHIDLMSVSPGAPTMPSLKIYAGRLHSKRMQELPIPIDASIDDANREILRDYHGNDLDVTHDLHDDLKAQIELRTIMSKEYGVDLRSKSDAQIAEAVIKAEIERLTGRKVYPPDVIAGPFKYVPPLFIRFETPLMQGVLHRLSTEDFSVDHGGIVRGPDFLKDFTVGIGNSLYTMGIGGLHSNEKHVTYRSDETMVIKDRDFTSYYPKIILQCELFPKHIGRIFLQIYQRIYDSRVAAKKAGRKNEAETKKITLNGGFGKFGSHFSALFGPNLLIQTTMTGQLVALMLIEQLELNGFSVISANTDGLVTMVPRERIAEFNAICLQLELDTGLMTEETTYKQLSLKDVNNYIALSVEKDGKIKVKCKGEYAPCGPGLPGAAGQKKNPNMEVCTDAVIAYLKDGTPIEETIEWCTDPRKYAVVRRVAGGAMKDGESIGKALRWYYAKGVTGGFVTKKEGNAVPLTIGAKLMMELPDRLPLDVDDDYYVREAYAMLQELGVETSDPRLKGRTGTFMGRLPDQKNFHTVSAATGVAVCGKRRSSIRDSWVEADEIPEGHRLCAQCRKAML